MGTDTLSNGQTSPRFVTTPGTHHLSTTMLSGGTPTGDTTVTLRADSTFTVAVNFYCS